MLVYVGYVLLLVFAPMVRRKYRIKNHVRIAPWRNP